MKFFSSALVLAMSSTARGSSKSAKSLTDELEEIAFSMSLASTEDLSSYPDNVSSYPEAVVVAAAKSSKSTKKRLFVSKSSKSNRRNLTTKSEKVLSYGVGAAGLVLDDAMSYDVKAKYSEGMSYGIEGTFSDAMSYLVDSTAPEVLLEPLSYVTTVIEASSKSSKVKFIKKATLAKSENAETLSENSAKSAKSSATEATTLIEPRSIDVENTPANFSPVDFTRMADVRKSDPAIDASSGALAAQISISIAFLAVFLGAVF